MNPGDTVILNCDVSNPSAALNILVWTVPIGGQGQLFLSDPAPSDSNLIFSAVATADDTARTVSSQLTFKVNETLDEMKVICSNVEIPASKETCTLLVLSKSL